MKNLKNIIINDDFRNHKELFNKDYYVLTDSPYNQKCKYNTYKDNLPEIEHVNLIKDAIDGMKSAFILYPEQMINLHHLICGGKCMECVAWVYGTQNPQQFRLICWQNCKPDMKRIWVPYKNPDDPRTKKKIEKGKLGANLGDWWNIPQLNNMTKKKLGINHPCPLPDLLVERIILTTTNLGDTIIDPFCGIGTIPRIAKELGRFYIGFEIDPQYCADMKSAGLNVIK